MVPRSTLGPACTSPTSLGLFVVLFSPYWGYRKRCKVWKEGIQPQRSSCCPSPPSEDNGPNYEVEAGGISHIKGQFPTVIHTIKLSLEIPNTQRHRNKAMPMDICGYRNADGAGLAEAEAASALLCSGPRPGSSPCLSQTGTSNVWQSQG